MDAIQTRMVISEFEKRIRREAQEKINQFSQQQWILYHLSHPDDEQ
ncbi:hypothetical protein DDB_G0285383 [Dictyostelium discoideum AX4]|uniref:Putative uncharacterized protein DDB_G0285383 n=1 Tax=Dictyostelium discoideum TaxID=44689 RepID=Y6488_DICDI|nr:hypothetical protein DDB_G0285383 [Dictyostelium discoideum AX4]Q54N95.1 RecName: Full=Putative uncharacterized protein DDB_G0285383 [Dictyostelium discoideum]EAL64766.1 hypothetical protein DDB_G0285383 [Dictyostelium discoideum AX4]|eukprot:XP_638285.1 hypothetical protein DDB_G0285383 [Dictyostelium discoideum AX4]